MRRAVTSHSRVRHVVQEHGQEAVYALLSGTMATDISSA